MTHDKTPYKIGTLRLTCSPSVGNSSNLLSPSLMFTRLLTQYRKLLFWYFHIHFVIASFLSRIRMSITQFDNLTAFTVFDLNI